MAFKVKRDEKSLLKIKNDSVESGLKEHCRPVHRQRKEPGFKKYRAIFLRSTIISTLMFIFGSLILIGSIYLYEEDMTIGEVKTKLIVVYFLCLSLVVMPYLPMHMIVFSKSDLAKSMYSWPVCKRLFAKIDKTVMMCHDCADMMLVSKTNVQLEYYLQRAQIFARQALLKVLKLTNMFIRDRYYVLLKLKYKRLFIKQVEQYVKELNGSLIMTYKGRVPKYVSDAFEQIAMNLIELRKLEVVI